MILSAVHKGERCRLVPILGPLRLLFLDVYGRSCRPVKGLLLVRDAPADAQCNISITYQALSTMDGALGVNHF